MWLTGGTDRRASFVAVTSATARCPAGRLAHAGARRSPGGTDGDGHFRVVNCDERTKGGLRRPRQIIPGWSRSRDDVACRNCWLDRSIEHHKFRVTLRHGRTKSHVQSFVTTTDETL